LASLTPESYCYSLHNTVPQYDGLCGTAECYLLDHYNSVGPKVRVLLDSGAAITLIDRTAAEQAGLTGNNRTLDFSVAGGGAVSKTVKHSAFKLKSLSGHVTEDMTGFVTDGVGNPFAPNLFDPKEHNYLKHVKLADKFPAPEPRPFQILLGEPYFSRLQMDKTVRPKDPALPIA
jgi:hypothetical protein